MSEVRQGTTADNDGISTDEVGRMTVVDNDRQDRKDPATFKHGEIGEGAAVVTTANAAQMENAESNTATAVTTTTVVPPPLSHRFSNITTSNGQDRDEFPEEMYPPANFAMVAPFIYRSGMPKKKNFAFLKRLGLKSIL
ncbi:hypothetical protein EV182_004170 [Spiromyces aspiralis]|uniref:Uncharacterized protein n=1 Tax=Spiromyces aspiralis TaxID=68401 RepID=A0ACC1HVI7_9FUNG|nr:hypothetical protein EV182_004170 [Spiromyces aspiralis]